MQVNMTDTISYYCIYYYFKVKLYLGMLFLSYDQALLFLGYVLCLSQPFLFYVFFLNTILTGSYNSVLNWADEMSKLLT